MAIAASLLALTLALALTAACRHPADDDIPPPVASAAASASAAAAPVDQLAPGELIEGADRALGLPLPRGTVIELRTPDTVIGYLEAATPSIDGFIKARAVGARFVTTPATLTALSFPSPTEKSRLIEVTVRRIPHEKASRIEVRDVTPAPKKDLPNDEARFREVGLDKNGKLLDPLHMQ